jgi:hypothetical protein
MGIGRIDEDGLEKHGGRWILAEATFESIYAEVCFAAHGCGMGALSTTDDDTGERAEDSGCILVLYEQGR